MQTDRRNKFFHHLYILVGKAYVQRQRRWRSLALECVVGGVLFIFACVIAKPVFLTPLQTAPEQELNVDQILQSLPNDTILGYVAEYSDSIDTIMKRAAELLDHNQMIAAESPQELDQHLYEMSEGKRILDNVIWVNWHAQEINVHKFSIRSTKMTHLKGNERNPHLAAGFLAVQVAVSQAVLEYSVPNVPEFELSLVAMPESPLMDHAQVKRAISLIFMCFTVALLLPVLDTVALITAETESRLKRALRLRRVSYSVIYLGWFSYALMTTLPMVFLGGVAMILIFRWVHILTALFTLLTYTCVMIVISVIMALYHEKVWLSCAWTILNTILQTFLAELFMHHEYDNMGELASFLLNLIMPPLGLVYALNQFALLQTGNKFSQIPVSGMLISWWVLIIIYFVVLMFLQRTAGNDRAIGGQQSWKSIMFKRYTVKVKPVQALTGLERENIQSVDELVAKAISFRNVSKGIMDVPILNNVTFDLYRCEFSMLFAEINQKMMMACLEDILTGLTFADTGTVHVLGQEMKPDAMHPLDTPNMMGYCDQSQFLMEDLTVVEHLIMFMDISLWHASEQYVMQYSDLRFKRLFKECDLEGVKSVHVKDLDYYYRAQLCWALATLLEPKVIIMANFVDHPVYMAVMSDKIVRFKQFMAIVKMSYSNIQLENADRVFVFDHQRLSFGGTPAYMFFKYGREYRLFLTLRSGSAVDDEGVRNLLAHAAAVGATVRSHMGCMLILRIATSPTAVVAKFIKQLEGKFKEYGITSMNLTLPDSDEVFQRSLSESRPAEQMETSEETNNALNRLAEPRGWKFQETMFFTITHFKLMVWKYYSYYATHKSTLVITTLTAVLAGTIIGLSVSKLLKGLTETRYKSLQFQELLTVESWVAASNTETLLVLSVEETANAIDLARGYVLSEAGATHEQVQKMEYTALPASESLTEYLITKAIDSPENYVYLYAYGLDVATDGQGNFVLKVLYSPMHRDNSAQARSMARAYMALMRFYTKKLNASIVVIDYPLPVGTTPPWIRIASTPPLLVQFLLVMTLVHVTLLPSHEYGLIRHFQSQARNFSPARYWLSLLFCDLVHYWFLVVIMCLGVAGMMLIILHWYYLDLDLLSVPLMLMLYGTAAVPQAYLFSLGPRPALNAFAFAIINIVFGEATIVTKLLLYSGIFGGEDAELDFMVISPQYNMAYAFVKIRTALLYNSECITYKTMDLCRYQILHMCCDNCGILQPCFQKKSYMHVIRNELIGCAVCCVVFTSLLLLWEYRVPQRAWHFIMYHLQQPTIDLSTTSRLRLERANVLDKEMQFQYERRNSGVGSDTFGEYLLAVDVSYKKNNTYLVHDVNMGLGKGEVLALSGLQRHGRLKLCELLAGTEMPSEGRLWAMSKYKLSTQPHNYCRNATICCDRSPLPGWMKVIDALRLVAVLRGIPLKHVFRELHDIIQVLNLTEVMHKRVSELPRSARKSVYFAAAVVGAPPIIVLDECTSYQPYPVRRAMYHIIYYLRQHGHSIITSDSSVECHLPVTNRLAIMLDGEIRDIDYVERMVSRYSDKGYTVVMHLKDDVDVKAMARRYFTTFVIQDTSEVLVNMRVQDVLRWSEIFEKMELLKSENSEVYSYIVCSIPIAYIYNSILAKESGMKPTSQATWAEWFKPKPKIVHTQPQIANLSKFQNKYDIHSLRELPWSVIFQT